MNAQTKQFGLRSFVLILVIAVLLFGGASITGVAAQSAIPGDALYPVKTTIEQTRLSLAQDAGVRAQMKMAFAQQRLDEIAALIQEGRYHEIREAVLAFEAAIHSAILELETISKIDPTRGTQIALDITAALTRYAQTLSEMAANAPESVKVEVTRALDTTQIAGSLELPPAVLGLDDNSNGDDGNFNANGNDNLNENGDDDNANANGNDNLNENGEDDNVNSNGNDNLNENDDDDNANSNGDDNLNENGDDDNANSNGNDNLNENGDDNNANGNGIDDNSNGGNGNGSDDQNGNSNDNTNDASGNDNGGTSGSGHNDNGSGSGSSGGGQDDGGSSSGGGGHGGNGDN